MRHYKLLSVVDDDKDEFYFRNKQVEAEKQNWRHLTAEEIIDLMKYGNTSSDWSKILVKDPFDASLIKKSTFVGLVQIGMVDSRILKYHDFIIMQGIENSLIDSCDIGNNCSIRNCSYISHYIIRDRVVLHRVDEMQTTDHAKFGVGVVKEGEAEAVRVKISIMNENEGRSVLPFTSMTCADAWLWGSYRADYTLMARFKQFTEETIDLHRGFYGEVGSESVIKSCRIIKDVNFGPCTYVKGANKLKNLTINSTKEMPSQIGEGVELVNGIIGGNCHIFYGCKAVRFVMMDHTFLKYGARLINSILGDNSTISCCEVLNNLVFPCHEQHHNNSFLIASNIQGLSNMAAGANIGSNHNSRGADGEIVAERGFWPALSSTLKHNCFFASYTLIAKGNYPSEMNLRLPFCLLSNDKDKQLVVMPAYWWMYNMYALERNSFKVKDRDRRPVIRQHIISDYLAPDTVCEIIEARKMLERWTAQAWAKKKGKTELFADDNELIAMGKKLLAGDPYVVNDLQILGEGIEHSKCDVYILKTYQAYYAYEQMLIYYVVRTLCSWCGSSQVRLSELLTSRSGNLDHWINLGGQLVPEKRIDQLRHEVREEKIQSWDEMHQTYEKWFALYESDKIDNAIGVLKYLAGVSLVTEEFWKDLVARAKKIRLLIEKQIYRTKEKDYENEFRSITYRNEEERDEVLGCVADNSFIKKSSEITQDFFHCVDALSF